MRPFLAIFLIVFSLNIALNYGLSDRATLGSRLIRGLSSKTQKSSTKEQNTVSEDMKKQMKRIDALEDIFIGSSGGNKKNSGSKSTRRSSVDDIRVLDKDLSKVTDEIDLGDVEKTLEVRSEEGGRLKRETNKDKTKKEKDNKKSKGNDLALEKELSDDKGTGYSDKDDSSSKKSTIPGNDKIKGEKDTKSESDLMGGAGGMSDDLESQDDYNDDDENDNNSEEQNYESDDKENDDKQNDDKEYDDEKNDDKSKSDDSESDVKADKLENDDDNRKSEIDEDFKNKNDDSETDDGEKKSAIDNSDQPGGEEEEKSDRKEPSFDDDTADKKSDGLSEKDTTADTKISCRTECAPVMDYETCAVPRCDYKMGTIKDLCQYLCHHQKERCEQICE